MKTFRFLFARLENAEMTNAVALYLNWQMDVVGLMEIYTALRWWRYVSLVLRTSCSIISITNLLHDFAARRSVLHAPVQYLPPVRPSIAPLCHPGSGAGPTDTINTTSAAERRFVAAAPRLLFAEKSDGGSVCRLGKPCRRLDWGGSCRGLVCCVAPRMTGTAW